MTRRSLACLPLVLVSAAWFAACRRAELSGPPTLRLGRDQCAECGMLLGEDRCAGALLVAADDERTHLVFDDIGCLLDYRAEHAAAVVIDAFVRDYGERKWLPATDALYVSGGAKPPATPMGSGIVAFQTREAAERQKSASGGSIADYAGVEQAHHRTREARSGGQ